MKAIYGILLAGVSALALGGCTSDEKAAFANALLGSGAADDGYAVSEASDAATDERTTGKLEVNYAEGDEGDLSTATLIATVKDGGQTAGPTEYAYSELNEDPPLDPATNPYAAFYRFDPINPPEHPETGDDNSILFAGAGANSYAAVVASKDPEGGEAAAFNIAGFFAGTAPTDLPTADEDVEYLGSAVAGLATEDSTVYGLGTSEIHANFGTGKVQGDLNFDEYGGVQFAGDMSTSHATYSASSDVAGQALTLYQGLNSQSAFGQVVGGFFGEGGTETAGTFTVQDHRGAIGSDLDASTMKITGAFGGTVVTPP